MEETSLRRPCLIWPLHLKKCSPSCLVEGALTPVAFRSLLMIFLDWICGGVEIVGSQFRTKFWYLNSQGVCIRRGGGGAGRTMERGGRRTRVNYWTVSCQRWKCAKSCALATLNARWSLSHCASFPFCLCLYFFNVVGDPDQFMLFSSHFWLK